MKKYFLNIVFVLAFAAGLSLQGCILDDFDTLTQNIPFSRSFVASGSATDVSRTESFSLGDSETYNSYRDKIRSIKFIQAAFRFNSTSSPNLKGDLLLVLKTRAGAELFTYRSQNINPNNFITTPLILKLTQSEIQNLDTYISITGNRDFVASFSISNISGGSAPYSVSGVMDIVFEMTSDL
ncbi:MAG: hypothetical protein ACM3RX_00605 [Methanococcaceae archaeon]